jgi:hypothetical protein
MNALRWDLDYFSKAHAAKQKGIQTGLDVAQTNLEQYYKDSVKGNQYNYMLNLYRQKLDNDKLAILNNIV